MLNLGNLKDSILAASALEFYADRLEEFAALDRHAGRDAAAGLLLSRAARCRELADVSATSCHECGAIHVLLGAGPACPNGCEERERPLRMDSAA